MKRWTRLVGLLLPTAARTRADDDTTTSSTTTVIEPVDENTTTTIPAHTPLNDADLHLVLLWHQHQTLYEKDENGVVTRPGVRIPGDLLGNGSPADWTYAVAAVSQEGFPPAGIRRNRDVEATPDQWRIGGGDGSINRTRILDAIVAEPGLQEAMLPDYDPVTTGSVDDLSENDFAQFTAVASP
jgi:hypothetical protein